MLSIEGGVTLLLAGFGLRVVAQPDAGRPSERWPGTRNLRRLWRGRSSCFILRRRHSPPATKHAPRRYNFRLKLPKGAHAPGADPRQRRVQGRRAGC